MTHRKRLDRTIRIAALLAAAELGAVYAAQPQAARRPVFSAEETQRLRALGRQFQEYQRRHRALEASFRAQRRRILRDPRLSAGEKQARAAALVQATLQRSRDLVRRYRQPVVERMQALAELSLRGAGGRIRQSLGTGVNDPAFRGHWGDVDAAGGERVVRRLQQAAEVMGLGDEGLRQIVQVRPGRTTIIQSPAGRRVTQTPAYVSVDGGLNLTVHKEGLPMGRVGDQTHRMEIEVNAKLPETYLSAGMRDRQIGQCEVAVQDHMKKARKGLRLRPEELLLESNAEALQALAKGTMKAVCAAGLSDAQIATALRRSGYDAQCTPAQFRTQLQNLKEGYNLAPEAAGLHAENIARFQNATAAALEQCDRAAGRRFESAAARQQRRLGSLLEEARRLERTGSDAARARAKDLRRRAAAEKSELIDSKLRYRAARKANRDALGSELNLAPGRAWPRPKAGHDRKGLRLADKVKAYKAKLAEHAGRFMSRPAYEPELVSSRFSDAAGRTSAKAMAAYFRYLAVKRLLESKDTTAEGLQMLKEAIPGYWVGRKYREGESTHEVLKELARELCPPAMMAEMAVTGSAEMMRESFNHFKQDQFVTGLYNRADVRTAPDGSVRIASFGGLPTDMVFNPAARVGTINGAQARAQVAARLKQADPELRYYDSEIAGLKARIAAWSKQEDQLAAGADEQVQALRRRRLDATRSIERLTRLRRRRERQFDTDEQFVAQRLTRMLEQQYQADREAFQAARCVANRERGYETDALKGLGGTDWIEGRGQEAYRRALKRFEARLAEAAPAARADLEKRKDELVFEAFRKSLRAEDHAESKKVLAARARLERIERQAAEQAKRIYRRAGFDDPADAANDRYLDFQIAMESALTRRALCGDTPEGREAYRSSREYQQLTALHRRLQIEAIEAKKRREAEAQKAKDLARRWCEKHGIPADDPAVVDKLASDYLHKKATGDGAYLKNSMQFFWEEYRAERAEKAFKDGDTEKALRILRAGQKAMPDSPVWARLTAAAERGQWPSKAAMAQLVRHLPREQALGAETVVAAEMAMKAGDKEAALAAVQAALAADPASALWRGLKKALEQWDGAALLDADAAALAAWMTGEDTPAAEEDLAAVLARNFRLPGAKGAGGDLKQIGAHFGVAKRRPAKARPSRGAPGGPTTKEDRVEGVPPTVESVNAAIPANAVKRVTRTGRGGRIETWMLLNSAACRREWWPNGKMRSEICFTPKTDPRYQRGQKHGVCSRWSREGRLEERVGYRYGRRHGPCEMVFSDGARRVEMYRDGARHGRTTRWRPNGKLQSESYYRAGVPHGPSRRFHENGRLASEAFHRDGKLHGVERTWSETGVLTRETRYVDGKRHGWMRKWSEETGAPEEETLYAQDMKHGVQRVWTASSSGPRFGLFLRGKRVSAREYEAARAKDPALPPIPAPPREELSMEAAEAYRIAGKEFKRRLRDGSSVATYFAGEFDMTGSRAWWPNGRLKYEAPVKDFFLHGARRTWDSQGRLTGFDTYCYGVRYGLYKRLRRGAVVSEGHIKNGWLHGVCKEFDLRTGKLRREFECRNGEVLWEKVYDPAAGRRLSQTTWDLEAGEPMNWTASDMQRVRERYRCYQNPHRPSTQKRYDPATGKLLSETSKDENGKLHGLCKTFYPDGLPKTEEEYAHGVLERRKEWEAGGVSKREEGWKVVDGRRLKHGAFRQWATSGVRKGELLHERHYRLGKLHGPARSWHHQTGKLTVDETYRDGQRDGVCKRFYSDGQLMKEETYKDGQREGEAKEFWPNGQVKLEASYKNDGREGWTREFLQTGQLYRRTHYRGGKANGPRIDYNKDGSIRIVTYWLNGGHAGEKGYRDALKKDPSLPSMIER